VPVFLQVTSCSEFPPGEFTQFIESNLVELTTSGKPSHESGLLVPLQVCGADRARHLKVTLVSATSEAGTLMASPPPFYVYRSRVWPAPRTINGHLGGGNWKVNAIERVNSTGWELQSDVAPGLYLLVFERDHYGSSTDPEDIPASITYRLEISPRLPQTRTDVTPTPVACSPPLSGADADMAGRYSALGCPRGGDQETAMARQRFQNGQMIWLSADPRTGGGTAAVFVLHADGSLQAFTDQWREGQPESDPALVPPPGLVQPIRGFGQVWREQLGGPRATIGWATEPEQGVSGTVRLWDGGLVVRVGADPYVLMADGSWLSFHP
jgi:hypothetical protein